MNVEQPYKGKKIAILGLANDGQIAVQYFLHHGAKLVAVEDNLEVELPDGVTARIDKTELTSDRLDFVFRSAGFLPSWFDTDVPVLTASNEYFERTPIKREHIVGVTGTKGKGTTCMLLHRLIQEHGLTSHIGGNFDQHSELEMLLEGAQPTDYAVLELSNTRLWDVQYSPHVAVVVKITPEHLVWHDNSMAKYVDTKRGISRFQEPGDSVIHHDSEHSTSVANDGSGQAVGYFSDATVSYDQENLYLRGESIIERAEIALPGEHNLQNIAAAILAAEQLLGEKFSLEAVREVLRNTHGFNHRLELVHEYEGVRFYDDSYGTTPETAIAVATSFEETKSMIMGGQGKGLDYTALAECLAGRADSIVDIQLVGETGPELFKVLTQAGYPEEKMTLIPYDDSLPKSSYVDFFEQVVTRAYEKAAPDGVVLLAPAATSLDMFENYGVRGDFFTAAAKGLAGSRE